jgi:hypothetical protein
MTQFMKYRVRVLLLAGLFAAAFVLTNAFTPVARGFVCSGICADERIYTGCSSARQGSDQDWI